MYIHYTCIYKYMRYIYTPLKQKSCSCTLDQNGCHSAYQAYHCVRLGAGSTYDISPNSHTWWRTLPHSRGRKTFSIQVETSCLSKVIPYNSFYRLKVSKCINMYVQVSWILAMSIQELFTSTILSYWKFILYT